MGGLISTDPCISYNDGGEKEFRDRYDLEERDGLLGQGEFGKVVLCHDKSEDEPQRKDVAVKILDKGIVLKDETLYAPIEARILQAECEILKELDGKHYCLDLKGVYETRKVIYVVTELCSGGEMMDFVSKQMELRTEDVSRISFQLLSAIDHCSKHGIIHRDVKAENVMFQSQKKNAELRLIDFGSGTFDKNAAVVSHNDEVIRHSTFVGSSFYMSPDMFGRSYTSATDVWSAGVTLYVLVAGYPANGLRKAFNILHALERNLRMLPNLPSNLPNAYFDLLEKLLTLDGDCRPSAGSLLEHEFVQFHRSLHNNSRRWKWGQMSSVRFEDSVARHGLAVQYQKFERAVTTILATVLSRNDLTSLLERLETNNVRDSQRLRVVSIGELKGVLKELHHKSSVDMIANLQNADKYDAFAYHIAQLEQFSRGTKQMMDHPCPSNSMSVSIAVVNSRISPLPGGRDHKHVGVPHHMRVQSADVIAGVAANKTRRDPPPFTSSKSLASVWKDNRIDECAV